MKISLQIQTREKVEKVDLPLNQSVVIGRGEKADFIIDDSLLSSAHCKLSYTAKNLTLEDLESKNGTFLNGLRVENADVYVGDQIKIGKNVITISPSESSYFLKFKGDMKHRMAHNLQVDYTGFRKNRIAAAHNLPSLRILNKPPEVQKHTATPFDKSVVRGENQTLAFVATVLDIILFVFAMLLPFYVIDHVDQEKYQFLYNYSLETLLIAEFIMLMIYLYGNLKAEFTIGEKIAGIKSKYYNG